MLQIITGRFFKTDNRFRYDGKGVLYSNYTWLEPIKTPVAVLEPVDPYKTSVVTYVISYLNQIEKVSPPDKDLLLRTGDEEIVEQLQLLATFGLKAFFHADKDAAATAFRTKRASRSDRVPHQFIPRFLAPSIMGKAEEVEEFTRFVNHVMGLKRDTYVTVIAALKNFSDALQVVGQNIDLSYSMFVYCLEALAQASDGQGSRRGAGRRLVTFVSANIPDSFFKEGAPQGYQALRRSELESAIKNAYELRSGYAHALLPILDQIRFEGSSVWDFVRWENKAHLTLSGMVRLVHAVMMNFILARPTTPAEDIDWRSELPGLMRLELAPEYWASKVEGLDKVSSAQRLGGFLDSVQQMLMKPGTPLLDMKPVLAAYEDRFSSADIRERMAMLATYFLFNVYVRKDLRSPNSEMIKKDYDKEFDVCTPEAMLTRYLFGDVLPWTAVECGLEWKGYLGRRHHKGALAMPPLMEVGITLEIGRKHLQEGNSQVHAEMVRSAILDASGWQNLQVALSQRTDFSARIGVEEICRTVQNQPAAPAT